MRASANKSFSQEKRLRTNSEFQAVFGKCRKFSGRYFTFLLKENNYSHARLGIGISKKKIKTAVGRNKVKRLIRESFRKYCKQLTSVDIVVVVQKEVDKQPKKVLFEVLDKKWQEIIHFYSNKS